MEKRKYPDCPTISRNPHALKEPKIFVTYLNLLADLN